MVYQVADAPFHIQGDEVDKVKFAGYIPYTVRHRQMTNKSRSILRCIVLICGDSRTGQSVKRVASPML